MRIKKIVSGLLVCALVATTVFTGNVATADAAGQEGHKLAVDYDFSKEEEGKIKDKSGNNNDATIQGKTNVAFDAENGVMELKNANAYVELPTSIMDNLTDQEKFTIETRYARNATTGVHSWLFCFGSNPQSSGANYMFYCPRFDNGPVRAGIKNASVEKLFSTARMLEDEQFYTVDLVFDEGTIKLYIDGVPIQDAEGNASLASGYSIVDDVIAKGCKNNVLGYIGKSVWSGDTNFNGKISSFKIYDGVLTDAEVQAPYQENFQTEFENAMTVESILGKNQSVSAVKYDLNLPKTHGDLPITWTSQNEAVVTSEGKVINPAGDTTVTLKARTESGTLVGEKTFTVTVKPADRSGLNAAVARVTDALNGGYCNEESKKDLQKAADSAAAAKSQTEIDRAISDINKALAKAQFSAEYLDPFGALADGFNPAPASLNLLPKQISSVKVKDVPASVKGTVKISYESQDTDVAVVDATGKVTAKNVGYAVVVTRIEAKYDGYAQEYYTLVKVDVNLGSVRASANAGSLAKGKTTTVNLVLPGGVNNKNAVITYRAAGAVSVNKSGKITAKSAGNGRVYVKVAMGGKSITRTVVVKVGDITGASTVKARKSIKLKVTGISGKAKWSLDKKGKKLAKISSSGKLTAKKAGKVKVTAKVGKVTMTKTIKIKK